MKFFLLFLLINTHLRLGEMYILETICDMVASSDNLDSICQLIDSKKFTKLAFCPYKEVNWGSCRRSFDFCLFCPRAKSHILENSSYVAETEARFYAGNRLLILYVEAYRIKTRGPVMFSEYI